MGLVDGVVVKPISIGQNIVECIGATVVENLVRLADALLAERPTFISHGKVIARPVLILPQCSLRGRSGARHPRHARAEGGAARGSGWLRSSHPLRCAPWLVDR